MAENNFSCIKEVVKTVHIPLPSFYLGKETKGVTEVLDSWKSQYNSQLQGILVSYKNISLKCSGSRSVAMDKPFVRYNVTAAFELFCPSIGSIVKGTINRISHDYIGCLIHNTTNATIKRSKKSSHEINQFVFLDNVILFKVTRFDFFRKAIRVNGEITEECVNLMKELPDFQVQSDVFENSSACFSGSEFSEDAINSDDIDKSNKKDNTVFADSEGMSPSLLSSVDYSTLRNSNTENNLNTSNPAKEISESTPLLETPSPSPDSNSSSENDDHYDKFLPASRDKNFKRSETPSPSLDSNSSSESDNQSDKFSHASREKESKKCKTSSPDSNSSSPEVDNKFNKLSPVSRKKKSKTPSSSSKDGSKSEQFSPVLTEKKSKKRKLDEIGDKHELKPKKKKKHMVKKLMEKSAKKKGSSKDKKSSSKKKKSKENPKMELLKRSNLSAVRDLLGRKTTDDICQESSMGDDLTNVSSQRSSIIPPFEKEVKFKKLNSHEKNDSNKKKSKKHQENIHGLVKLSSKVNNTNMINNTAVTSGALVKEELSTDSVYPSPSPKSKKSKKSRDSEKPSINAYNDTSLKYDDSTDTSTQLSLSPKKKKSKKLKNVSINMSSKKDISDHSPSLFRIPHASPKKKQKKPDSQILVKKEVNSPTELNEISVKQEVDSDNDFKSFNCVSQSDFNAFSPGKKNLSAFPFKSTDELMNAFSRFEPSLEDQLLLNETSAGNKEAIMETTKGKKRKRDSSDKSDQPKKKKKTDDVKSVKKNKNKLHKKSNKKDKGKSEKIPKKDKKKKLKDKSVISKKKSLEYKNSLKKKKKLKDVKSKKDKKKSKKDKSSHHETKYVPSDIVIKSENS